jgi:hypothetical protein
MAKPNPELFILFASVNQSLGYQPGDYYWHYIGSIRNLPILLTNWMGFQCCLSLYSMVGISKESGRLSTVDLLFKVAFCKRVNITCNIKRSWSWLVSPRRSTILSRSIQWRLPGISISWLSCLLEGVGGLSANY